MYKLTLIATVGGGNLEDLTSSQPWAIRAPHPSSVLGMYILLTVPTMGALFKDVNLFVTLMMYMMIALNHIIIIIILIQVWQIYVCLFVFLKKTHREETWARFPCKCLKYIKCTRIPGKFTGVANSSFALDYANALHPKTIRTAHAF